MINLFDKVFIKKIGMYGVVVDIIRNNNYLDSYIVELVDKKIYDLKDALILCAWDEIEKIKK